MAAGKYKTDQNYDDDINFIKDSDEVQGDPAGTDPDNTPLTGPINVVIQKIVSSLAYLKNAVDNFTVKRMTDTVEGIGRTATQQEAEAGTAHGTGGPVLTVLRGIQMLRSAVAAANTTRRGTVERATQNEAVGLTDTERFLTAALVEAILRHANAAATTARRGTVQRATENQAVGLTNTDAYLTAVLVKSILEHANAQATESKRGTAEIANESERRGGTDNERFMTSLGVNDFLANNTASDATISVSSGTITVDTNIQLGKMLFMRVKNAGESTITSTRTWTLSGGAWRILTGSYFDNDANLLREGNPSGSIAIRNFTFNTNNTTFRLNDGLQAGDILHIIAVLN